MSSKRAAIGETVENPAATADAEQHARQDIAGLGSRLVRLSRGAAPLAAAAGALVSGWLVLRRRRRR